jgi:hypothetical protein
MGSNESLVETKSTPSTRPFRRRPLTDPRFSHKSRQWDGAAVQRTAACRRPVRLVARNAADTRGVRDSPTLERSGSLERSRPLCRSASLHLRSRRRICSRGGCVSELLLISAFAFLTAILWRFRLGLPKAMSKRVMSVCGGMTRYLNVHRPNTMRHIRNTPKTCIPVARRRMH